MQCRACRPSACGSRARGNTLADIDALPVPVSVTPSGHLVVDPLEPVMRRAVQAFVDAWQRSCDKAGL